MIPKKQNEFFLGVSRKIHSKEEPFSIDSIRQTFVVVYSNVIFFLGSVKKRKSRQYLLALWIPANERIHSCFKAYYLSLSNSKLNMLVSVTNYEIPNCF